MTLLQHHRLMTSLLLLLTLMLPSWSSEALNNNVSGPRDNSLSSFSSKLTSAAAKDPKSDRHAAAVVGSSTPGRVKAYPASWTPVCRNYSCPSSTLDPAVEEPGARAQQPDRQPGSAEQEPQSIVGLMRSVSEELSGLRSALQHLKLDSQAVHRQLKRLHRASCGAARRARRRTKWAAPDEENRRLRDTDGFEYDEQQLILARHHRRRHHHHHGTNRCPAEFTYSPATGTCYLLRGEQVTWDVADRHCRRLGAQLVTIQSSTEQRQLTELARTNSETAHCDFWIGLRRSRSKAKVGGGAGRRSSWEWTSVGVGDGRQRRRTGASSNVAVYGHWNSGEPNDAGGNEDCVQAMWVFSWRWNDTPCRSAIACYACQTSPTR